MLSSANFDIICLQTWTHRQELETPLKKELNKFVVIVKKTLGENKKFKTSVKLHFNEIFLFRLKGLKWLLESGDFDVSKMLENIYPDIERYISVKKFSLLAENILFALRSNKRVAENLIDNEILNEDSFDDSIQQIGTLTYSQFIASLTFAIPDIEASQTIIDWINSSLIIEFGTIASMLLFKEEVVITQKRINELSGLISDAAQEYTACAIQMGLLKISSKNYPVQDDIPVSVVNEEKTIADWGFNDYTNKLRKE